VSDSFSIQEVVRRTGLTSRALRFYEARGLIAPLRAGSGRRFYGAAELERIHQIVTLKRAGLTLEAIGRVLGRGPHDLGAMIDAQLDVIEAEAARLADIRALLVAVKSRLARHETLDPATLCQLIHDSQHAASGDMAAWQAFASRYMDESVQAEFVRAMPAMECDLSSEEYNARWRDLGARISAALPLAHDSAAALGFVREWMALLAPFSAVASPAMWEGARAIYDDVDNWRGEGGVDPGFDGAVWRFIGTATSAALARGEDIGPVPAWMQANPSQETE
jgi:MerR family transcriptional regulator, thiopeptide resistance regulator